MLSDTIKIGLTALLVIAAIGAVALLIWWINVGSARRHMRQAQNPDLAPQSPPLRPGNWPRPPLGPGFPPSAPPAGDWPKAQPLAPHPTALRLKPPAPGGQPQEENAEHGLAAIPPRRR